MLTPLILYTGCCGVEIETHLNGVHPVGRGSVVFAMDGDGWFLGHERLVRREWEGLDFNRGSLLFVVCPLLFEEAKVACIAFQSKHNVMLSHLILQL